MNIQNTVVLSGLSLKDLNSMTTGEIDFLIISLPLKWNYVKMMCFGESVQRHICDQCKPFVLSANFLSLKKTQPVAEQIAYQFKRFWESCNIYKGRPYFKMEIFYSLLLIFKCLKMFTTVQN
jgi:hypothetical protein